MGTSTRAQDELRSAVAEVSQLAEKDAMGRIRLASRAFSNDTAKQFAESLDRMVSDLLGMYQELLSLPLYRLPDFLLDEIRNQRLLQLKPLLERAQRFRTDTNNPIDEFNAIHKQVSERYYTDYKYLLSILSYLRTLQFSPDAMESAINSLLADSQSMLSETVEAAGSALREVEEEVKSVKELASAFESEVNDTLQVGRGTIDSLKEDARNALGMKDLAAHAGVFQSEADTHQSAARWWLVATVAVAVFMMALAALSYLWIAGLMAGQTEPSAFRTIQFSITKLIVFSVLYWMLIWTGKNYRAHRHNVILNEHRKNAIGTFEGLVDATANPDVRDAVLMRSTEAIFGQGHTGYASDEGDSGGAFQVMEVIRSAMSRGPSN